MSPDRGWKHNGGQLNVWRLILVMMLVIGTVFAVMVLWLIRAQNTDAKIHEQCRAIVQLAASRGPANLHPGDYGYSYAQQHPEELPTEAETRERAKVIAETLGCPEP